MFLLQNARGQSVVVVRVQHRHDFLQDDGAVVEVPSTKCTVQPETLTP